MELLDMLRGRMPNKKKTLEMKLWVRLDFHSRGFTHYRNILNMFKADYHPQVINGRMRPLEISKEFEEGLRMFDQMKEFLLNARIANDLSRMGLGNTHAGTLADEVLKLKEFNEWYKFFVFEEDDDYRYDEMFKDVFGVR
jgi:hypothetical protein